MVEKVTVVKVYLTEKVQMVIDRDQTLTTLEKLVSKLRTTYANQVDWNRKLYNITQEEKETVTEFLARIRVVLNKTDDNEAPMNKKQLDDRTLKIFWYKSKPEIEKSLTLLCPSTIEKAFAHVLVVEENTEQSKETSEPPRKKVKFEVLNTVQEDNKKLDGYSKEPYNNDIGNRFKQLNEKVMEMKAANEKSMTEIQDKIVERINNMSEHLIPPNNQFAVNHRQFTRPNNYFRGGNQHTGRNTNHYQSRNNPGYTPYGNRQDNNRYSADTQKCHNCGKGGHSYKNCWSSNNQQKNEVSTRLNPNGALKSSVEGTAARSYN